MPSSLCQLALASEHSGRGPFAQARCRAASAFCTSCAWRSKAVRNPMQLSRNRVPYPQLVPFHNCPRAQWWLSLQPCVFQPSPVAQTGMTGVVQAPPPGTWATGQAGAHRPFGQIGRGRYKAGLASTTFGCGFRNGRRRKEKKPRFWGTTTRSEIPDLGSRIGRVIFEEELSIPS